ncbi:MAG TPA: ABC transporter permease [Chryseolinea sp.]
MIRSFFATAIRHLLKNVSYTVLNVAGLSIGLACFIMIGLWVQHELSYDSFHEKSDRIYRVAGTFTDESGQFDQAVTCIPLAPALANDLPEVENTVRLDMNDAVVRYADKQFSERNIIAVDPSFFEVFSFKLLKGNPATALKEPYNIVLSQSMAQKYFGDEDPLGQSLKIFQYDPNGQGADYKVTGIVEDCPGNSHFNYNFLFSFKTVEAVNPNEFGYAGWFNNGYYTYLLLKDNSSATDLQAKLSNFLEKYIGSDMKKNKIYWSYFLQPLTDIHTKSDLRYEIRSNNNLAFIVIFGAVGFIVLLLACINYINLSTAYSADRFKEVGVRKVMGACRNQLVIQYLIESLILVLISLAFSIVWIELARPLFESLTGNEITKLYTVNTLTTLLAIAVTVGVLSGIYPSLILSSFKTVNVLKGHFTSGPTGAWLRKSLVVFQYAVTIVLISSILVTQRQLHYIDNKNLGFNKENLLILNVNGSPEVRPGYAAFKNELMADPTITGLATSSAMISGGLGNRVVTVEDVSGKKISATMFTNPVDADYIETYGMKLTAGRNFVKDSRADSSSVIVNEATTRAYGYTDPKDALGREILFGETRVEIIGVVSDFHYNTLRKKIEPTCMFLSRGGFSRVAVRLNGDIDHGLRLVTIAWKKHFPNTVLEYGFAEERVSDQYRSEQQFAKLFMAFSLVSLAIACLGLFALVSYSVKGRTKEIGIRKVLGASVGRIVSMLSLEFIFLILLAGLVAMPVGYYLMEQWLQGFEYRIPIGPEVFLVAGTIALFIAVITISIKSVRSALANPVNSLRNE